MNLPHGDIARGGMDPTRRTLGATIGMSNGGQRATKKRATTPPSEFREAAAMQQNASIQAHLSRASELATRNVHSGGGPFGAIIVTADGREFEGINRVTANNDPTAHAEVTAIRAACAEMGTFDLTGATLYTSCEPCPMCLASALWARVERVYFGADRHDAANAGFDDAAFYDFFENPVSERSMRVEQCATEEKIYLAPFIAWGTLNTRIEY